MVMLFTQPRSQVNSTLPSYSTEPGLNLDPDKRYYNIFFFLIFKGPCIVRYKNGIYDQQDATNSQYFIVIIALQHHDWNINDRRGEHTTYTPYGCTYSSELLMMGNDSPKHVEQL
jgi:hypothetical protein